VLARRVKKGQAERSAAMQAKLIAAAKQSLMDRGYGRTTAVEVCARAGVTRGALFHHFSGLSALFAATLDETCAAMGARARLAENDEGVQSLSDYIEAVWRIFGHPDFKIVIEVWLAARNDEELRVELQPVIERIRRAMSPDLNPELAKRVGASSDEIAMYRLVLEAMIGMALGRAISPGGTLGHEGEVIALLKDLARARTT
jgi:AcrR family transcriptional regulator